MTATRAGARRRNSRYDHEQADCPGSPSLRLPARRRNHCGLNRIKELRSRVSSNATPRLGETQGNAANQAEGFVVRPP
jgi:hypothetical protein